MINVSISYGFGDDNRYHNISTVPERIQLALYKYDIFQERKKEIFEELISQKTEISAIHMPLDYLKQDRDKIFEMMEEFLDVLGVNKFIIHPNKNVISFCQTFLYSKIKSKVELCIENFQWRKKKELRSPLKIIEYILLMKVLHLFSLSMCLDTSHTEDHWFNNQLMSFILPYTSVIHLSNRIGRKSHLPFNVNKGDLNLVGFVKNLKRYDWQGEIVLEYMPEYSHKLTPNKRYIERLLGGSEKI